MPTKNPVRFAEITSVAIVILIAIIVGVVLHERSVHSAADNLSQTNSGEAAKYYTCLDQPAHTLGATTNACRYGGNTYEAPTSFSPAAVRGYSKLSYLAAAYVLNTSKQYFDTCQQQGKVAETNVYDVQNDTFILFGLGGNCGSPSYKILENEAGAWKPILTNPTVIFRCDLLESHRVPKTLFTAAGFPATCLGGSGAVWPYVAS
jgi:hypothetical protein